MRALQGAFSSVLLAGLCSVSHTLRVGMMYEPWHTMAYHGIENVSRPITVEAVLRSNGTLQLSDIVPKEHGLGPSGGFWWHTEPADGFGCLYRKRWNETEGYTGVRCPGITQRLTGHAKMFTDVGIDFIAVDNTNFYSLTTQPPDCPGWSCAPDAIQMRPTEVIAEEFSLLRRRGIPTPQIAVWQNIPAGKNPDMWWYMLERIYRNETYKQLDLIFKDSHTGKQVFFVPDGPDPGVIKQIEASGEVVVVQMWAEFPTAAFSQGMWAFMSPCTTPSGGYTTGVVRGDGRDCEQYLTTSSAIGPTATALTVGPSYQLTYSSLPFQAAGKFRGTTLRRQFVKAFKTRPDYLMVSTFNEAIAQQQPNPNAANPRSGSMGLRLDDSQRQGLWVDMFGGELARDLQPTKEVFCVLSCLLRPHCAMQYGDTYWKLLTSCLRVYLNTTATDCGSVQGELCCAEDPLAQFLPVWSLTREPSREFLLTPNLAERNQLLSQGWKEMCNPYPDNDVFCAYGGPPIDASYNRGPFYIFTNEGEGRIPVYRCYDSALQQHSISGDSTCKGQGSTESLLGYTARSQDGGMLRPLLSCKGTVPYHSVDHPCETGDSMLWALGYVH